MSNKTARILLLSDEIVPMFYQNYRPGVFDGVDLIISCGDLSYRYLEFIATVFKGYVLYVPGNHDEQYLKHPPLGCVNIDGKVFVWKGLRIFGLGGSMRYKEGPYQYTQKEMNRRLKKAWWQLFRHGGIDIFVAHSPAYRVHDGKDICHTGFEAFITLIEKYHPAYFFHGHVHMNYGNYPRKTEISSTTVINGYRAYMVDVPLPDSKKRRF